PPEALRAVAPSTDHRWRATELPDPPSRKLPPTPTIKPALALAPTYAPERLPGTMLFVGANTPHVKAPPAVKPKAPPTVDIVPSYASKGPHPSGVKTHSIF